MALFVAKTLLEAAQGGAQTKRHRDFVVAHFNGEGAIAVPNSIWAPAAAWANANTPSGNRLRDRGLLLQRLDVYVTRRGTTVASTTGSHYWLGKLRNQMKQEGLDIKDWNFPPDQILDAVLNLQPPAPKPEAEAKPDPAKP
jgi:hypothetical protein